MAFCRYGCLLLLCAACSSDASSDHPDAATSGDGNTPDASLCMPACSGEPNADVACTVFATCESTCSSGFARCGASCVTETPAQCGADCAACPDPANGSPTCSDGV